jgi:hypothetical protein
MSRPFVLSAVCAASLSIACAGAFAQSQAKHAKTTKPAAHASQNESAPENVSPSQIEIASRVLTGEAKCEMNQHVGVQAIDGKPGHFHVSFKNVTYTMVPQETTTGAVRLEDRKAGVVWIQIPSKSMMLNSKIGQRMVDGCATGQQRT